MFSVYILSCKQLSYHWGITKNIAGRLKYHSEGKHVKTKQILPVTLVFEQDFQHIESAIYFENKLQELTPSELEEVIKGRRTIEVPSPFVTKNKVEDEIQSIVLPSTYLGNLAYFKEALKCGYIQFDIEEQFIKQTYRSRTTFLSANGIQNLIVPVIRPNGKQTKMKDVQISYAENWIKDHVKAIESAYRKTPFYAFFAEDLFAILGQRHERLVDLNYALFHFLYDAFGCEVATQLGGAETTIPLKILVTPKSRFDFEGKIYHQTFVPPSGFESNLSIIDLLFNIGPAGIHFIQ